MLRRLLSLLISLLALWCCLYMDRPEGVYTADPFTIAIIAGGVLTAKGQIDAGRAAEAQGKAEQRIAQFNALQKEREAKSRVEAAGLEEERVAKKQKIFQAEQRVRFAKSGITVGEGTELDFLVETAGEFATERALTLRQGLVESSQLKGQAKILRAQGALAKSLGKAAKRSSRFKAAGTILTAVGASGVLNAKVPTGGPTVQPAGTFDKFGGLESIGRRFIS